MQYKYKRMIHEDMNSGQCGYIHDFTRRLAKCYLALDHDPWTSFYPDWVFDEMRPYHLEVEFAEHEIMDIYTE